MWLLLFAIAVVASGALASMALKKNEKTKKEHFQSEQPPLPKDDTEMEMIDRVSEAYEDIKGKKALPSDIKRVMKMMNRLNIQNPEEIIKKEFAEEKRSEPVAVLKPKKAVKATNDQEEESDDEEDEPSQIPARSPPPMTANSVAKPPPSKPSPGMGDPSMILRIENELESMVNRMDSLLEEIQQMKGRAVNAPMNDMVETFVPYGSVM
ncbi:hypothetical protein TetV_197 [Tetraselmis virus 1]|uniref:Uncharacterized protein n=1 Tax=Tetraselmis virus 1 TaxID=2060617 RepID=A0A2P0VNH0_9VIRU|nr:hypothetical protein QJ968_gp197 [Tetraselmis virus 1]AUF82289.1 hypothetical protein TetV_197 [Tetraselmis virus 1]